MGNKHPEICRSISTIVAEQVKGEMQLEGEAIHKAALCWMGYTTSVGEIEESFGEIDLTKDGVVDKQALEALLTRLNEGVPPQEDDLDYVMSHADCLKDGVLHRPELVQAISLWYSLAGRSESDATAGDKASAGPSHPRPGNAWALAGVQEASSSACCALQ